MPFDNWDEIRTAYQVARVGTVSGAAEVLGVHHATVIRHIDALEAKLGTKLFQRHPRGYTPTEAGQQLLSVGKATEDQFAQLASRITGAGEEVTGELVVTSLPGLATLAIAAMKIVLQQHPGLRLRFLTDQRVFRLEYGEAHVAIRGGTRPTEPDNVVQSLGQQRSALYASHDYLAAFGTPKDQSEFAGHRFIGSENRDSRAPYLLWLAAHVPEEQVVMRANGYESRYMALVEGLGMGFLPTRQAEADPRLVQVMPPREEWMGELWLVTHVDLHRTTKVQTFVAALKEAARNCPAEI
ncbi:LysR family transcriptional regulator [Acidimangrovimonas sediminis]|uniref:LysR family transcriptional regulator n=1 Tax=Acidimangrovimonas sediminis TaxID=2056283 RepID=UPI000C800C78|nr:LysR family transcriptional regulator [Acidimangrovimonas sediminis]